MKLSVDELQAWVFTASDAQLLRVMGELLSKSNSETIKRARLIVHRELDRRERDEMFEFEDEYEEA